MPTPSDLPATDPSRAAELLGPPPLNPGDEAAGYERLLARLVAEVRPSCVIEEDCVRLAAFAESRRAAALRELLLYRDTTFAARLRGAVAAVAASADRELTEVAAAGAAPAIARAAA
jgi:hypothetical protein